MKRQRLVVTAGMLAQRPLLALLQGFFVVHILAIQADSRHNICMLLPHKSNKEVCACVHTCMLPCPPW